MRKINKDIRGNAQSSIIYGTHAVTAALNNQARKHIKLVATQEAYDKIQNQIPKSLNLEIKKINELNSMHPGMVHQGLVLYSSSIFLTGIESINNILTKDKSCIVILDQVTDPQNIGSIIRSALAFDIDAIIIPENNAPNETSAMVKASSGAIEKIHIVKVTNLVNSIKYLKKHNYWVTGLDSNTNNYISEKSISNKTVFILGSEGKGLRALTLENCDFTVKLPMSDKIDSINVSNAAAIAMYEWYKICKSL